MIGAPDPCVINNRVVRIDAQIRRSSADPGAAHAKKHIVQRDGIARMICVAALRANLD